MQHSIREFVAQSFGKHYYPVYHGRSNIVVPLALIVKKTRQWWRRPFGKEEARLLGSLEHYVQNDSRNHFHDVFRKKIQKEDKNLTKSKATEIARCVAISVSIDQSIPFFSIGFQSSLHCILSFLICHERCIMV